MTHTETGQAFAMKTIRRQSLTRELDVQHVLLERDILTFTDNPFVVSLFCTFETDADLCIVMEYVAGERTSVDVLEKLWNSVYKQ